MSNTVIRIGLWSIAQCIFCFGVLAQERIVSQRCDSLMLVSGKVSDGSGHVIPAAMVVNRSRIGGGQFVDYLGTFLLAVCPGDTLAFGAIGFHTVDRIAPVQGRQWNLGVQLRRLQVEVGIAEVVAPRELREILRDIEALGYNEEDYRISKVDAISSPITWLYEALNRDERSKRLVAEMENKDRRHDLLRELFIKYVDYDIISLNAFEFDAFIAFCDPGDELLQEWTQYEFIRYIQQRFELFRGLPSKLNESDYQYQLD